MIDRQAEAITRLAELLASEGPTALDDPIRLRGLISDRLAGMRREVPALIAALQAGIPQQLRSRSGASIDRATQQAWETELVKAGLDAPAAEFAVAGWMEALGLTPTVTRDQDLDERTVHEPVPWYRRGVVMGGGAVAGLVLAVWAIGGAIGGGDAEPSFSPAPSAIIETDAPTELETDPPPEAQTDPPPEAQTDPPTAPPAEEPDGVPTAAGTEADDWLYQQVYWRRGIASCEIQSLTDVQLGIGVIAAVECDAIAVNLDSGVEYDPSYLQYRLFDSTGSLESYYEFATGRSGSRTDVCGTYWYFTSAPTDQNGYYLCGDITYESGNEAAILEWTEDDWRVYASMYGDRPVEDLSEFFEKRAIQGVPENPQH